jgi:hypothetical protein
MLAVGNCILADSDDDTILLEFDLLFEGEIEVRLTFATAWPGWVWRLSRCLRRVARDRFEFSRWRKNGVKYSTIFSPGGTSRSSPRQLLGHCARSGQ